MKFIKGPTIVGRWSDDKNRTIEFDIEFRVAIGRQDIKHTSIPSICEQAIKLLMPDPRRSESFPIFTSN